MTDAFSLAAGGPALAFGRMQAKCVLLLSACPLTRKRECGGGGGGGGGGRGVGPGELVLSAFVAVYMKMILNAS